MKINKMTPEMLDGIVVLNHSPQVFVKIYVDPLIAKLGSYLMECNDLLILLERIESRIK